MGEPEFNADGSRLLMHQEPLGNLGDEPGYSHTVWDAKTGKLLQEYRGFPFPAFSHDTKWLLRIDTDSIRIVDVTDFGEAAVLSGHRSKAVDGSFSENDSRIVTSGDDGSVRIWELENHADAERINLPLISPDPTTIATSDPNRIALVDTNKRLMHLWDFSSKSILKTIALGPQTAMHVTNDDRFVALAASDGKLRLLKSNDFSEYATLGPFESKITSLDSDATGKKLEVAINDDTVRIFDISTLREIWTFRTPGEKLLGLSPDAEYAAGNAGHLVHVWKAGAQEPGGTFQEAAGVALAIPLNFSRIVTKLENEASHLWDATQAKQI